MARIRFKLRFPNEKQSPIQLDFHFNGNRLRMGIGASIEVTKWNFKKERAKESSIESHNGSHYLNDYLDTIARKCTEIYKEELSKGVPDPRIIENRIKDYLKPAAPQNYKTDNLYDLINRFINNEFTFNGKQKTNGTLKVYKTSLNHLKEFERRHRYRIDFDTITMDFYHKFTSYLLKQGKKPNTLGKQISVIKSYMNMAIELKLTENTEFRNKKFKVTREASEAIFLTEKEIIQFYQYDFSNIKRLEKVRDLFVFGCFVGLRFSDFSEIKPENIINKEGKQFIQIKTQKTKYTVYIPCHPIVLQIFKKYEGQSENNLPPTISNQKFNLYLKEAAKIAGLNELGRLESNLKTPLYDCIESHTARRSFASNYYRKVPDTDLMKITGHTTIKAFQAYIRTTKYDAAQYLGEIMEKEYSKSNLKIVAN